MTPEPGDLGPKWVRLLLLEPVWNAYVPGLVTVNVALVPAKRPPSAPGGTTPVSKVPSSAVMVWGLPPTLANRIVDPAGAVGQGERPNVI